MKKQNSTTLRKRIGRLLLLGLIVSGCGIAPAHAQKDAARTIEILAVNDMHAAIDNFPRFGFMVDSLRAIYPDLLLISGGDNQTGNPVNDQYPEKGLPMIELMNAMKFDLSAIGNHEFDSKPEGLANNLKKAGFEFICANIKTKDAGKYPIKPYKSFKMANGLNITFVSLLDLNDGGIPDSHPDNVKEFTFNDPYKTAGEYLFLKDKSDVLVFLNHMGFENDVKLTGQLPAGKVDLIIGGHSHTKVDKEQIHNGILITQAERKLKYATLIKLTVQPNGKIEKSMQLLTVGNKGKERADIREMVNKYNDAPSLKEKIAIATDDFKSYEEVGFLMIDALRASTGTDIALINPGGVRIDHLAKGAVTVMDVYSMDPFGNEIVVFKLSGREIKALLTQAYKFDEYLPIYPSGMRSLYLLDENNEVKDIILFTEKGMPLDMSKKYSVSMNGYMASVYKYEHEDPGTGLFRVAADSMIEYLKELQTIPSYRFEKRVELIR